jgi:NADH-quinone oxidoreductase subunit E
VQELTPHLRQEIDKLLRKYPDNQRQSAVISALMLLQQANAGWLTVEDMDLVADYLNMPRIAVYEVASFYSMFELKPIGKHKICVCTNISCMLCGSDTIVQHLQQSLNIKFNETTADGRFTLKSVECLAACNGAPMMQIGNKYYENLTPAKVDKILAELD